MAQETRNCIVAWCGAIADMAVAVGEAVGVVHDKGWVSVEKAANLTQPTPPKAVPPASDSK